jgi:hypothetical protein
MRNPAHRKRLAAPYMFNGGGDEQRDRRQPRWRARQLGRCIEGLVQRGQIGRERRPVGKWLFRWQLAEYDWKSVRRWARQRCTSRESMMSRSLRSQTGPADVARRFFRGTAAGLLVSARQFNRGRHLTCGRIQMKGALEAHRLKRILYRQRRGSVKVKKCIKRTMEFAANTNDVGGIEHAATHGDGPRTSPCHFLYENVSIAGSHTLARVRYRLMHYREAKSRFLLLYSAADIVQVHGLGAHHQSAEIIFQPNLQRPQAGFRERAFKCEIINPVARYT